MKRECYSTVVQNDPLHIQTQKTLHAHGSNGGTAADHNAGRDDFIAGTVGVGDRMIVVSGIPVQLQFSVIVCRRTPDIEAHRAFQQGLVAEGHLVEQTGQFAEYIGKLFATEDQSAVGFTNMKFTGRGGKLPQLFRVLVSATAVFQRQFIKTEKIPFFQYFRILLAVIEDFEEASAFFGNIDP